MIHLEVTQACNILYTLANFKSQIKLNSTMVLRGRFQFNIIG